MTDPKVARCFDPEWRYVKREATDISKTFARIRRQMKDAEAVKPRNVQQLPSRKERKA